MDQVKENIKQKIETLTAEQLLQIENLIDALQLHDSHRAVLALSEPAFAAVWNDPENDIYDAL